MKTLDEQEKAIVRHLVRDPRESDNGIGELTGVNVRTVSRKRQRLEQEGILSYYVDVNLSANGACQFNAQHLYITGLALLSSSSLTRFVGNQPKLFSPKASTRVTLLRSMERLLCYCSLMGTAMSILSIASTKSCSQISCKITVQIRSRKPRRSECYSRFE